MFNCYRRTQSISQLRERAVMMTVHHRMSINRLKFFFQILHGHYRLDISKYITWETSPARTKHTKHIKPLKYRTDCLKYSFFVKVIDEWNSLPHDVVNLSDVKNFEAALRTLLLLGT